ncbi:MAG: hypothetical protein IKS65_01780 [Bacteroidales bacterium]|nr:hypothetical protein [Bacteroidales bacterium]
MRNRRLYIAFFVLTIVLLTLPAVQQHSKLFKVKKLNGVTVATKQPKLSLQSFMSGEYQKQEDKYLAEYIGFREHFIRCYNQLAWSLFRKTQNKTLFINHDNWIFNDFTIRHHYGQSMYDFRNSNEAMLEKMQADARMLWLLQNVLKEYGVSFFVCLAPGKDMVCSEHVPEVEGFTRPRGIRAIEYYPHVFDSLGINYIDFQSYCMAIKDTVSYPLYLKSSSHWSNQASVFAADTLFRYMEELSGLNIHNFSIGEEYVDKTRYPDADLEDLMNLLWPIETGMKRYNRISIDNDTTAVKPKWLTVGDSYYQGFLYNMSLDSYFDTYHYWYYNKIVYNDPLHSDVKDVDILQELLSSDIVMVIYAPSNLFDINRQFLTRALFELFFDEEVVYSKLEDLKKTIRNSEKWYASVKQNAANRGIDVDHAVDENAIYTLYSMPGNYFDEFKSDAVPSCRNSRVYKVLEEINDNR